MIAAAPKNVPAEHAGYSRADLPHSPMIVFFEVTRACDLVCLHCRAFAERCSDPNELSPEESLTLIDQLAEFPKPPMLVITGGDPLKRPDVYDIIEHATSVGLEVAVTPSATPLVTDKAIRRMRDCGMGRIAVSLDAPAAGMHDEFRGVLGSFACTLRIIAIARRLGIPVQVNTTLTPRNFDEIEAMSALFQRQQIAQWSVFFLVPVGRAQTVERLNAKQCEQAFSRLWRQAQIRPFAIKTTEAPHYRRYVLEHRAAGQTSPDSIGRASFGLNDGKGVMFVSHTGLIHPSGFLPLVCGMFPFNHPVKVYQHSPVFRRLRDANALEGKCRLCEYRHACGGSRARAYAVTGNPYAQEPDCNYVPASMR